MARPERSQRESSLSPKRGQRNSQCLIVDGYNILAQLWQAPLKDIENLEDARQTLLEQLAEYQAFTGEQVYLVFDAYHTSQAARELRWRAVHVIYTAPRETADQRIERLVYELRLTYHNITVASSDVAEQQVAFGGGGLRIPAKELLRRMEAAKAQIESSVETHKQSRHNSRIGDMVKQDLARIFENWRRE